MAQTSGMYIIVFMVGLLKLYFRKSTSISGCEWNTLSAYFTLSFSVNPTISTNFGWLGWIPFYSPERGQWQLISGSCLPKATVVVTSRPPTRMSFKSCQTQESKYIELVGFTEEDRVKYAESIFSSQHNREDNDVHPIALCHCSSDL